MKAPHHISTGIASLDQILDGGLPENRLYVIEGSPGAGKTTLAVQFLLEGIRLTQRCLYVTLSETADELAEVARSHGWSLDGIDLLELNRLATKFEDASDYTVYHPADVELGERLQLIRDEMERVSPVRVVLDSVSELKILAETTARYRREILALKQFFSQRQCTVLVLDDLTVSGNEPQLQSIAHGVIRLERQAREYGDTRRQLHIVKMRGVRFRDGFHDFRIESGGLLIYPRLSASDRAISRQLETTQSGLDELDRLLGSGLDRGSSSLIVGPAGCGKSTLATQFIIAAVNRGEAVACFLFEENRQGFLQRAVDLGLEVNEHITSGRLELSEIDPGSISPGEFSHIIKKAVEERNVSMVLIDSLNGYLTAMTSENFLLIQMRELLSYLNSQGVVSLIVLAQSGMIGQMHSPIDVSFLADTVLLIRFFETEGEVRQALSVVKKRRSRHEKTIRELKLGDRGIRIGEPLRDFEGVLTGVPRYRGNSVPLLSPKDQE